MCTSACTVATKSLINLSVSQLFVCFNGFSRVICVDPAADLQRIPCGRGKPRLPSVVALPHQRSRRPSRLFARRRRVLQLVELGEPPSLPDVVDARHPSRVARADELRRWVAADSQGELFPTPTLAVEIATCEDCLPYGEVCPQFRRKGLWIFRAMDHSCLCRAVAFITLNLESKSTPTFGFKFPHF